MPRLSILPFKNDVLALAAYHPDTDAVFREIFDPPPDADGVLQHFARPTDEAEFAVVLRNRSNKPVAALQCVWTSTGENGRTQTNKRTIHSYGVATYRPAIPPAKSMLITPDTAIEEIFLETIHNRGGGMGGGGTAQLALGTVVEWEFELSAVIFEDGEIVGPDTYGLAGQIQCERTAVEFVDSQIRLAYRENRDPMAVLDALKSLPRWNREMMLESIQREASWRVMSARFRPLSPPAAARPPLPKFYRRDR